MKHVLALYLLFHCCCTGLIAEESIYLEDSINNFREALLSNDFTSWLDKLNEADRNKLDAQWEAAKAGIRDDDSAKFNASLAIVLNDNAAEHFSLLATPYLEQIDLNTASTYIRQLSKLIASNAHENAKEMTNDEKHLINTFLILSDDFSNWVTQSNLNKQDTLKQALSLLCQDVKKLTIKDMASLKKLGVKELLQELATLNKSIKQCLSLYDINVDAFLSSIKASGQAIDSNNRTLTISFKLFNKNHHVRFHSVYEGERWILEGQQKKFKKTP